MRTTKISLIVFLIFILFSCARLNEGAVDLRKVNESYSSSSTNSIGNTYWHKNYSDVSNEKLFVANDMISLHLKSAYIKNFSDDNYFKPWIVQSFSRTWRKPVGEIAIVANALQMSGGKELDQIIQTEGRVVFYSNDVHQGQFLNFNNMPIYGPLRYEQVPFGFRISIFELDIQSQSVKAMLQSLAAVGAVAYPPASPALKVLNSIGENLGGVGGSGNDTEFRYSMVLDPTKAGVTDHFALEVGNYIFVRSEDRAKKVDWDNICLHKDEARLYRKHVGEDCQLSTEKYTDDTYVIVEIAKNSGNVDVQLAQDNYSSLLKKLEEKDAAFAKGINAVGTTVLDEMTKASKTSAIKSYQSNNYAESIKHLAAVKQDLTKNSGAGQSIEVWSNVGAIVKFIRASLNNEKYIEDGSAPLSEEHVDYFILQLAKLSKCKLDSPGELEKYFGRKSISEATVEDTVNRVTSSSGGCANENAN